MTTLADSGREPRPMTFSKAMRTAWLSWFFMLAVPFVVFLAVVVALNVMDPQTRESGANKAGTWFVINMAYLAVSVPLSFFGRSHLFKRYYNGQIVEPRKYLMGMMIVWVVLEIGGLLSLAASYFGGGFAPNIVPAIVAFVLFLTQWPKGHAMVRPTGNSDDFEHYEEPR